MGVPLPGDAALTVAVNVTVCPYTEGLTPETTDVVELSGSTVSVQAAEVLVRKLPSPLYAAVINCEPTGSALVMKVALPPLSVALPRFVMPSMNVTLPVGVPLPGALALTVTENVTD